MTQAETCKPNLVFERDIRHPPERVWQALTDPALLRSWLMENDFRAELGHRFQFRAAPAPGWSGVTNCEVIALEPLRRLAYRWGDGTESDIGLRTVVTWTLTPRRDGGTRLRLEQSGFRPEDARAYQGASAGWQHMLDQLEANCTAAA